MGCRPSLRIGKNLGDDPTLLQHDDDPSSDEAAGPLTKAVERAKKGIATPAENPGANGLASADSSAPPAVVAGKAEGSATPPTAAEVEEARKRERRDSGSGKAGSSSARSPRRPANNGRPGPDYKQLPPGTPSPPPAELQRPESPDSPGDSARLNALADPVPTQQLPQPDAPSPVPSNGVHGSSQTLPQGSSASSQPGSKRQALTLEMSERGSMDRVEVMGFVGSSHTNMSPGDSDGVAPGPAQASGGRIPDAAFSDADVWLPRTYDKSSPQKNVDAAAGTVVKQPGPGRVLGALKKAPAGDADISRLKQAVITAVAKELGHDPGGALSDSSDGEGTSPRKPVLSPGRGSKDPLDPQRQLSFVEIPAPDPQQSTTQQQGGKTPAELFEAAFGPDPSKAALLSPGESSDSSAMSPNARPVLSPTSNNEYWAPPHPPYPTAADDNQYPVDEDEQFDPYAEAERIRNAEPVPSPHALHRNAFGGDAGQHPLSDSSGDEDDPRSHQAVLSEAGSPRGNPHLTSGFCHPRPEDEDALAMGFDDLDLPENRAPLAETGGNYVPYSQERYYEDSAFGAGFGAEADALELGFDDLDMSGLVSSPTGYMHPGQREMQNEGGPVDLTELYAAAFGNGNYGDVLSDSSAEDSPRGSPRNRRETTPPSNTPNPLEVGFEDLHLLRHESLKERYRRAHPGEGDGEVALSSDSSGEGPVLAGDNPLFGYSAGVYGDAEYGYGNTAWEGYAQGPELEQAGAGGADLLDVDFYELEHRDAIEVKDLYERAIGPDPGMQLEDSSEGEDKESRVPVISSHPSSPRADAYSPTALEVGYDGINEFGTFGPHWGDAASAQRSVGGSPKRSQSPSSSPRSRGEPVLSSSPRTPNGMTSLDMGYSDLEYMQYQDARNKYQSQAGRLPDSSDEEEPEEHRPNKTPRQPVLLDTSPRPAKPVIDPLHAGFEELHYWDRNQKTSPKSNSGGQAQDQQPGPDPVPASEAATVADNTTKPPIACP